MMKKRILASSMASVMALSSVSVVAFADEAKKDYGEAVTKDELQAYVDSFEKFVDDELDAYGEVQEEDFNQALAHANDVLEDSRAKETDYTAAYQMLKAVRNELRIYANDELKALVKSTTSIYNTENILNVGDDDEIYKTDSWDDFKDAWEDADGTIGDDDDRAITDAYITLYRAEQNLEKKDTIFKSEFRKALKEYEAIETKMIDYEPWRRGTPTVKPSTKAEKGGDITKLKGAMTYGDIIDLVYNGDAEGTSYEYYDGKPKSVSNAEGKMFAKDVTVADRGTEKALYNTITEIYEELDEKGFSETSNSKYINAYKTAVDAVKVFNGWEADDLKSGTESKAKKVEGDYHAKVVNRYISEDAVAIKNAFNVLGGDLYEEDGPKVEYKSDKATLKLTTSKNIGIIYDTRTGLIPSFDLLGGELDKFIFKTYEEIDDADLAAAADLLKTKDGYVDCDATRFQKKSISSSKNILEYLTVTPADIEGYAEGNLSDALDEIKDEIAAKKATKVNEEDPSSADKYAEATEDFETGLVDEEGNETPVKKVKAAQAYVGVPDEDIAALNAADGAYGVLVAALQAVVGGTDNDAIDDAKTAITDYLAENTDVVYDTTTGTEIGSTGCYDKVKSADTYVPGTATQKEVDDVNAEIEALIAEHNEALAAGGDVDDLNLADALGYYQQYQAFKFYDDEQDDQKEEEAEQIITALTVGGPQFDSFKGSGSKEYTLVWRNLSYALDDVFPVAKKTDKDLNKLEKLIEEADEIVELTGDSAAFAVVKVGNDDPAASTLHMTVVEKRQIAREFYKEAKLLRDKFDENKAIAGLGLLDDVYSKLESAIKDLKKALGEFEVSYGDIRDAIGKYATAVDKGEVKSDALVKAINKCAYQLSVFEASHLKDGDGEVTNYAFDEDGKFMPANRLKTKKDKVATDIDPTKTEKSLKAAYEDMVKAYTDATTGSTVANDFNGDGAFTTTDLKDILDAFTASSTDTKYDVNKDGSFTTSDLKFALDAFTAQA